MDLISAVGDALRTAFSMFWEILWPLVLGFTLSGVVQAVVSHRTMSRYLGCDGPRCLTFASLFGAASSSCSYAAVALARSLFRKGASFTSAMAFELASTNLVLELGIILIVLLGWQFTAAEFAGGILMVILLALVFRITLTRPLIEQARAQANKGLLGSMEGHAEMDMSVAAGSVWQKLASPRGFTAVAHYFAMDWASVWKDIAAGLLIAGALAAWVPDRFWQSFFLTSHPTLAKVEGPLIGPLVSVVSFVCSVGNVPLAAVLWRGGISFGGVVSFIFADLIVLPILDIYRKYYGWKMAGYIFVTFYLTMAVAGYVVELVFGAAGIIPTNRSVAKISEGIAFNYTSWLNVAFLLLAAVLVWRFLRTNGLAMLRMMDKPLTATGDVALVTDPVCGMQVNPLDAAGESTYQGQTYYFCSAGDKQTFDRTPARYVRPGEHAARTADGQRAATNMEEHAMVKDVVCGMDVDPQTAHDTSEYNGQRYSFCSPSCKRSFDAEPAKYARTSQQPSG